MEINLRSEELEKELAVGILERLDSYLEVRGRLQSKTDLMTRQQVYDELEINQNTLMRWEKLGLKRYTPPIENSKKVYYRTSDILKFLGVD